jgi:hypothetical protein
MGASWSVNERGLLMLSAPVQQQRQGPGKPVRFVGTGASGNVRDSGE